MSEVVARQSDSHCSLIEGFHVASSQPEDIADILTKVVNAGGSETVSFRDVLDAFGQRLFGPMLMVPAFIAVAPTGAIPGMSLITGSVIGLIAGQLLLMRKTPWLPQKLTQASLSQEKLAQSVERAQPYVEKVDSFIRPRLTGLTEPPFQQVLAAICIAMALSMFPLALLPFAVAIPGAAVLLIGIGLTTHDGYFALAGSILALVALILPPVWALGWLG